MFRGPRLVARDLALQLEQMLGKADQPPIADPCRAFHGRLTDRADPDWHARARKRRRLDDARRNREVPAAVRELLAGQRQTEDGNGFLEPTNPILEAPADILELMGNIAEARSQNEAIVRQLVQRVDLLGDRKWMMRGQRHDVRAKIDRAWPRQSRE